MIPYVIPYKQISARLFFIDKLFNIFSEARNSTFEIGLTVILIVTMSKKDYESRYYATLIRPI